MEILQVLQHPGLQLCDQGVAGQLAMPVRAIVAFQQRDNAPIHGLVAQRGALRRACGLLENLLEIHRCALVGIAPARVQQQALDALAHAEVAMHGRHEGQIPAMHLGIVGPLAKALVQKLLDGAVPANVHQCRAFAGEKALLLKIGLQVRTRCLAHGAYARLHLLISQEGLQACIVPVGQGRGHVGKAMRPRQRLEVRCGQAEGFQHRQQPLLLRVVEGDDGLLVAQPIGYRGHGHYTARCVHVHRLRPRLLGRGLQGAPALIQAHEQIAIARQEKDLVWPLLGDFLRQRQREGGKSRPQHVAPVVVKKRLTRLARALQHVLAHRHCLEKVAPAPHAPQARHARRQRLAAPAQTLGLLIQEDGLDPQPQRRTHVGHQVVPHVNHLRGLQPLQRQHLAVQAPGVLAQAELGRHIHLVDEGAQATSIEQGVDMVVAEVHIRHRDHPHLLLAQPAQQGHGTRLGRQGQGFKAALLGVDEGFQQHVALARQPGHPGLHQRVMVALVVQPLGQHLLAQRMLCLAPRRQHLRGRVRRQFVCHQLRQALQHRIGRLDTARQQGVEHVERHAAHAAQAGLQPILQVRQIHQALRPPGGSPRCLVRARCGHRHRKTWAGSDGRAARHRHRHRRLRTLQALRQGLGEQGDLLVFLGDLQIPCRNLSVPLGNPAVPLGNPAIPVRDQGKQLRLFRHQCFVALGGGNLPQVSLDARPLRGQLHKLCAQHRRLPQDLRQMLAQHGCAFQVGAQRAFADGVGRMQPVLQQRGVDPRQAQPLAQAAQQPVVVEHIAQVLKVPHLLQPAAAEEKVGGGHEYVARQ